MTYGHWELVLVHELVHYRFPNMNHDRVKYDKFLSRVKEILLENKQFEPMHVLAGCPQSSDVWKCNYCNQYFLRFEAEEPLKHHR